MALHVAPFMPTCSRDLWLTPTRLPVNIFHRSMMLARLTPLASLPTFVVVLIPGCVWIIPLVRFSDLRM